MAGKIRHLLFRKGRYYARRIVPKEIREFIKKNEVRIPLGSDRREAIEQLPFALVKISSLIDHARDALKARAANAAAGIRALSEPMSDTALAKDHYQRLLARDKRPAATTSGRLSTWLRETGLTPLGVAPTVIAIPVRIVRRSIGGLLGTSPSEALGCAT